MHSIYPAFAIAYFLLILILKYCYRIKFLDLIIKEKENIHFRAVSIHNQFS